MLGIERTRLGELGEQFWSWPGHPAGRKRLPKKVKIFLEKFGRHPK
jgi:hypothetical protein